MPSLLLRSRYFRTVLLVLLLAVAAGQFFTPRPARAVSTATNIIANPSFENGVDPQGIPVNWGFETCEGVANATASVDTSLHIDGSHSAKIFTGPITNTGCFGPVASRTVGFTQFRQSLTPGLTFNNLTDSPNGFGFWFYLQQYGNGTMGGFEVRVFGAESTAELDYYIDLNPSFVAENYTDPSTGRDGLRSLLFTGYQPGQWYHFSRNLRADWGYPTPGLGGLNMSRSFSLVQFEGLAIKTGGTLGSETFWLDDVRAYVGTGPISSQTNIVSDPGFEDTTSTAWFAGSTYGNGTVSVHDTTNSHTGTHSALLSAVNRTLQCSNSECKDTVRGTVQQNFQTNSTPTLNNLAGGSSFSAWWYIAPSSLPTYSLHIGLFFSDGTSIEYWYGHSDLTNQRYNLGAIPSIGSWFQMRGNLTADIQGVVANPSTTRLTSVWFGAFGGSYCQPLPCQGTPHGETAWVDDVELNFNSGSSSGTPDFTISANPKTIMLSNDQPTRFSTISLVSLNGFSGNISLSASISTFRLPSATSLGPLLLVSFNPQVAALAANSSANSTMAISPGVGAVPGSSFLVDVMGTNLCVTPCHPVFHIVTVLVQIAAGPDFNLELSVPPRGTSIVAGENSSVTVYIFPLSGIVSSDVIVTLTALIAPAILNAPILSLHPVQASIDFGTSNLEISTNPTTALGNYTVTVTGTSGSLSHSIKFALIVLPPPVLKVNPLSGSIGTQVVVQGSGFPHSPVGVDVTFDNQLIGFFLLQHDSFNFTFNVPLSQPGLHHIHAVEQLRVNLDIQANFTVLPSPAKPVLNLNVTVGSIYFPGETATIFITATINGQPTALTTLQVVLIRPDGSSITLNPVQTGTGSWKATYTVPGTGAIGTYEVVVKGHEASAGDRSAQTSFEVKPTWLQAHMSTILSATGLVGVAAVLAVAWKKGLTRRRNGFPDV